MRAVILHLRKHGKTVDDFIEYTYTMDEERRKRIAENEKNQAKYEATLLPCPECKAPMVPRPVNTGPGDQTGDDSKIAYICINDRCLHQIFE